MSVSVLYRQQLPITGNFPSVVGGTGTTIKFFPAGANSPGLVPNIQSTSMGIIVPEGSNVVNGQTIHVKANGNFTISPVPGGSTSPAVTVALYPVTFNQGSNTVNQIGGQSAAPYTGATSIISQTLAAASDNAGYYPWSLSVDLMAENLSGLLQAFNGVITIDGVAGSFSNSLPLSGININNSLPFGLVCGLTFSVSDANAQGNMYQFALSY